MATLDEVLKQGVALVFLGADPDPEEKLPTGMIVSCHRDKYDIYFEVNGSGDFEYVNSYPVKDYADPRDYEDILMGGMKLAIAINKNEVEL